MDTNALCKKVIETSAIFVVGLDTKGRIEFFNKGAEKISGYDSKDVISKDWFKKFIPTENIAESKKEFKKMVSKKSMKEHVETITTKDGKERFIKWEVTHIPDKEGKVQTVIGMGIDVTGFKESEEALRESEGKYRMLFEGTNDAIFIADPKTTELFDCNSRSKKLTGYSREELLSVKMEAVLPKDRVKDTIEAFKKHVNGDSSLYETEIITKNGKRIPVEINSDTIQIGGKKYVQGVFRDITERKAAEEILKLSKSKLDSILSTIGDTVFMLNKDGRFVFFQSPEKVSGYLQPAKVMEKKYSEVMPPKVNSLFEKAFAKNKNGEVSEYEYKMETDGEEKSYHTILSPVFLEGKFTGAIAIVSDVTESKESKEELENLSNEVEKLNRFLVNREMRVVELKKKIAELRADIDSKL